MTKREDSRTLPVGIGKRIAIAAGVGLLLTLLLTYISAVLVAGGRVEERAGYIIVLAAAFAGALLAGAVMSNGQRSSLALYGIAAGAALLPVLILLGALTRGEFGAGESILKLALSCLLGGLGGGFIRRKPRVKRAAARR